MKSILGFWYTIQLIITFKSPLPLFKYLPLDCTTKTITKTWEQSCHRFKEVENVKAAFLEYFLLMGSCQSFTWYIASTKIFKLSAKSVRIMAKNLTFCEFRCVNFLQCKYCLLWGVYFAIFLKCLFSLL